MPSPGQGKQKASSTFSDLQGQLSARRQALLSAIGEKYVDETLNRMLLKHATQTGQACSNPPKNAATSTHRTGNVKASAPIIAPRDGRPNLPIIEPGNGRPSVTQANEIRCSDPPIGKLEHHQHG